jgi:hypothetical protein
MCMVEDGLRHLLKRVKSCANFSIELHALHVKVFPFSQMSVHRPDSEFPGDGRPELGQPTSGPESAAWV